MKNEALTTELSLLRKQAEQTAQNIIRLWCNLFEEKNLLRRTIKEYKEKRVELFRRELQARGKTWCTQCSEVILENEANLLLLEGTEKLSWGYGNIHYHFNSFSKLHRVCPTCRERNADKHGQVGVYDSWANNRTNFYAFRVDKREDGAYYACKFGNWVKLDDKNCSLDEPSSKLVEKMAEELSLPPRLEIESSWRTFEEERLIIQE